MLEHNYLLAGQPKVMVLSAILENTSHPRSGIFGHQQATLSLLPLTSTAGGALEQQTRMLRPWDAW